MNKFLVIKSGQLNNLKYILNLIINKTTHTVIPASSPQAGASGIVLYFGADSGQAGMTTFVEMTLIGLLN